MHWEVKEGGRSMKDVGGAVLAGSTLALESVEESSAAVSKPRGVWLRMPVVKNLEEARRLPVRVEEQQAQQLAMNPPRSAGAGKKSS